MSAHINIQIQEACAEEISDFFDELLTSGAAADFVFGFTDEGYEFCIDIETGDVEITYEDGRFENIPASDPRSKTFLDGIKDEDF